MTNKQKSVNTKYIVNNVKKVIKKRDMSLLSKAAYNFIILEMGFIAHYDRFGFIGIYQNNLSSFVTNLLTTEIGNDLNSNAYFAEQKRSRNNSGDEYVDSVVNTMEELIELAQNTLKEADA